MDDFTLLIDLTNRAISLNFMIPVPFLLVGIFLVVKGRMINEAGKGFIYGNATIIGIACVLFCLFISGELLVRTIKDRNQFIKTYLEPHPAEITGTISTLDLTNADSLLNGFVMDGLEFRLLKPLWNYRDNGDTRIRTGATARLLYQSLGDSNVVVRLELKTANTNL